MNQMLINEFWYGNINQKLERKLVIKKLEHETCVEEKKKKKKREAK